MVNGRQGGRNGTNGRRSRATDRDIRIPVGGVAFGDATRLTGQGRGVALPLGMSERTERRLRRTGFA